jgi:spore maturation protein A
MLNYIWGGLIIFSLLFAVVNDANDIYSDTWKNGEQIELSIDFPANADILRGQPIRFTIPGDSTSFEARWRVVDDEVELVIPVSLTLPVHWKNVAENQESSRKQELRATVISKSPLLEGSKSANSSTPQVDSPSETISGSRASTQSTSPENTSGETTSPETTTPELTAGEKFTALVVLPEVNFVKIRAITSAAFSMAEAAVTLALGLIGIMALWLGLMKIAEVSGLINIVVRGVRPFMKWLFPEIPKDHPAMGMISLNLAANILGLGNAATPLGIKAMEELQKLNPDKDSATNSMCMFLALNTSSVQLLPPVTLVAIMGLAVNELMIAITITTFFSTAVAIIVAKWYARRNPPLQMVTSDGSIVNIENTSRGSTLSGSASSVSAKSEGK